ncbi:MULTISPECIES: lipoprotein [unclassified Streptomyces]|uniref:lipoprotein n=1 Tax=unclassified Streptomyces TaxID=2593676 RepID=UPI0005A66758|nr:MULTISPECIES: lipoprotein [unclassified Streptomyces]
MAGRRRVPGVPVAAQCLLLVSLLVALVACGRGPTADGVRAEVQALLDRRADAVLGRDAAAYARTGTRAGYDSLSEVPLADWSYRVTDVHRTGATATATADLGYRVEGYDRAPVTTARTLRLSRDEDGRWSVDSDRPAGKSGRQLWDQGAVRAVHGERSLVLGVGRPDAELRDHAALADHAVPAVSDAWGTDWPRRVVVLVPGSLEDMAGLLGSPASSYRGIAAVTTGETGSDAQAPADRVIVNPDAFGMLGDPGRQVVVTHETTHVATRAHTTAATPLWLSEGFADWVGHRGGDRLPAEAAPELARAVSRGEVPAGLPADDDFGFTDDADGLARAYESGWMACRLVAERWGEERLGAFYRAVGAHGQRDGAVQDATRRVLGTTPEEFTAQWQEYLREQFD